MEDLKNTIDNTNKYKNDLKLAKNKINERILSGGQTIPNTRGNAWEYRGYG